MIGKIDHNYGHIKLNLGNFLNIRQNNMIKKWLKRLPFALSKNHRYDLQSEKVLKRFLKPDSVAIDIGCHEGEFLDLILKYAPNGRHLAFEPLPDFYEKLKVKYEPSCQVFNVALSDKKGKSTFNYVVSNPAYSGLLKRKYDKENEQDTTILVNTGRLDDYTHPQKKINLIKIDVEGGELQVLKGALNTLKRDQPVVIFEHGLGAADVYNTQPALIYQLLADKCQLQISTMEKLLKGKPSLSLAEFQSHFYQKTDYYFIAYPTWC